MIKLILGLAFVKERFKVENRIYSKFLGIDYYFNTKDETCSIIISNSISWIVTLSINLIRRLFIICIDILPVLSLAHLTEKSFL